MRETRYARDDGVTESSIPLKDQLRVLDVMHQIGQMRSLRELDSRVGAPMRQLFEHRAIGAGLVVKANGGSSARVEFFHVFPQTSSVHFIARGITRAVHEWLRERRPMFLQENRASPQLPHSQASAALTPPISALLVHGMCELGGEASSIFVLDIPAITQPRRLALAFELLVPHLHAALVHSREYEATTSLLPATLHALTKREQQILDSISQGMSNQDIARRMRISAHTVRHHLEHIFEKLDVRTRTSAVAIYLSAKNSSVQVSPASG